MATVTKPRRKSRKAPESRLFVAHDPDRGKRISAMDPAASGRGKTFWCAGCLRHGKQMEMEFVAGKPVPYFRKKSRKDHHPSCPYKNLQDFVGRIAEEQGVLGPGSDAGFPAPPAAPHPPVKQLPHAEIPGHPDHESVRWMGFIQRVLAEVDLRTLREKASFHIRMGAGNPGRLWDLAGYVSEVEKMFRHQAEDKRLALLIGQVEKIAFSGDFYLICLSDGDSRKLGIACKLVVSRFLYDSRAISRLHGKWVACFGWIEKRHDRLYRMEIHSFPEQMAILDPSLPGLPAPHMQLPYARQKFIRIAESLGVFPVPDAFFRIWYGRLAEEQEKRCRSLHQELEKEIHRVENQMAIVKQEWRKNQDRYKVLKHHQEALEQKLPRAVRKLCAILPVFRRLGIRSLQEWDETAQELNRLTARIRRMHEQWLGLEWKREMIRKSLTDEEQVLLQLKQLEKQEQSCKRASADTLLFARPVGPEEVQIFYCSIQAGHEEKVRIEWSAMPFRLHDGFYIPPNELAVHRQQAEIRLDDFEQTTKAYWEKLIP